MPPTKRPFAFSSTENNLFLLGEPAGVVLSTGCTNLGYETTGSLLTGDVVFVAAVFVVNAVFVSAVFVVPVVVLASIAVTVSTADWSAREGSVFEIGPIQSSSGIDFDGRG